MKKFYFLFIALSFSISALNAQNWTYTPTTIETISAQTTESNITIYANSTSTVAVDASSKSSTSGTAYSYRLKLSGSGNWTSTGTVPNYRIVSFAVSGDAKITVVCMSSSSTVDRLLNVCYGDSSHLLGQAPANMTTLVATTFNYTGPATTIYLYSPSSGVNIYEITVASTSTTGVSSVFNTEEISSIEYYTVTGVRAGTLYEDLKPGIYIKKISYKNGEVKSEKIAKKQD
jgi:hypothetical protein